MSFNLKKYLDKKVYIELGTYVDETDETEEDTVQGGKIYESLEDVMSSCSEGDKFLEVNITGEYQALEKVFKMVKIEK